MHQIVCLLLFSALLALCAAGATTARPGDSKFHVLVLYENSGHHIEYSKRARVWLDNLARNSDFAERSRYAIG